MPELLNAARRHLSRRNLTIRGRAPVKLAGAGAPAFTGLVRKMDSSGYCLLASPLMVSPEPKVLLRMKYPLPSSTITDPCVLLIHAPSRPSRCSPGLPNRFL